MVSYTNCITLGKQGCTWCGLGYPINLTRHTPKIFRIHTKMYQHIHPNTSKVHEDTRRYTSYQAAGPAPWGRAGGRRPCRRLVFCVSLYNLCVSLYNLDMFGYVLELSSVSDLARRSILGTSSYCTIMTKWCQHVPNLIKQIPKSRKKKCKNYCPKTDVCIFRQQNH